MSARLTVYSKGNKAVPAKYLEINGEVIRDRLGDPYMVPAGFDWNTYMGKFERLKRSLEAAEKVDRSHPDEIARAGGYTLILCTFLYDQFHATVPGSPSDIQRTYNGYTAKDPHDFVPAFTPAADSLPRGHEQAGYGAHVIDLFERLDHLQHSLAFLHRHCL